MNYILHGSDQGRIAQRLNTLKNKYHIHENVVSFDATNTSIDVVLNEMDSVTIFDDQKMIVVDHSTFLSSKDTTKYDLAALIARTISDESVIVVYICYSDKLDTRKKLVKEMISKSTVYSCAPFDADSQKAFIKEKAKEYHVSFEPDAFSWFSARVGMDPLKIEKELIKLSTYSNRIDLSSVQALMCVEPLDDVFKMVDALFEGNPLRLLSYYRNFRTLNMEPIAIIGLLASQIRFLFQVRVLMDQGYRKEEISSYLKAHPYRIQINMQRANRFSSDDLLDQLSKLAHLEQDMKMGKVDKDTGFEQWILKNGQ